MGAVFFDCGSEILPLFVFILEKRKVFIWNDFESYLYFCLDFT